MSLINPDKAILSSRLASTYTVYRKSGHFGEGGYIQDPEESITMRGPVTPASQKEIDMVPEGDRVKGMMTFRSTQELKVSNQAGISDEAEWKGERYKLIQLFDYGVYGHWKAIGSRVEGT